MMDYRREIDGLRALAVLPVILFHAGFEAFSGGFVGVDVFFVISGYLITTIILAELEQEKFSIVNFYERRARRILPALFFVMFISSVAGYFLLMPDEFKNLGQSLVATSLFSNNVLLALTSGYWDLASEFKPLLHTWSLGVEEQYYVVVPILLALCWKIGRGVIPYLLWFIFFGSLIFAIWFVDVSPKWAFYILPARAWEVAIGALAAIYVNAYPSAFNNKRLSGPLGFIGFLLVLFSIFSFDRAIPSPSYYLLMPTMGAVLLIAYCRPGSLVYLFLSNRISVFIGLLSYSLYLWHQPVFAYLRIYSREQPGPFSFLVLLPIIFLASYLSWRFIETPFRNKTLIKRRGVFIFSAGFSFLFVALGLYLNNSYGMPLRVFDSSVRTEEMDKRIYNEKAFSFKADSFSKDNRKKILILGDSFARDFTNITVESYDISGAELIYRDDLGQCIIRGTGLKPHELFTQADAIVFASGRFDTNCSSKDISFALSGGKRIYFVGTKDFGYNLNWLIRLGSQERRGQFNVIPDSAIKTDFEMATAIPPEHYISLIAPASVKGRIPITDDLGRMLSTDRAHLTKYGAIYFGEKAVIGTSYSTLFK